MDELVSLVGRFDVSPLNTILLVALFAVLRYIGNGLVSRIELLEARVKRSEELAVKHHTSLAVIRTRLDIVEEDQRSQD